MTTEVVTELQRESLRLTNEIGSAQVLDLPPGDRLEIPMQCNACIGESLCRTSLYIGESLYRGIHIQESPSRGTSI